MRVFVRLCLLIALASAIVFLSACGGSANSSLGGGANPAPRLLGNGGGNMNLHALLPADLNADGVADAPVHGALRRLLVQAPAGTKISLTRAGDAVAIKESRTFTTPANEVIFEIELAEPLGEQPCTLRAGAYELKLLPSLEFAEQQDVSFRPAKSGCIASDVVNPTAAVFETPADVQLVAGGPLPTFFGPRFNLVCGEGEPIELDPGVSARGVTLTPKRAPLSGRCYRVVPAQPMTDAYGRDLTPKFSLGVRPAGAVCICRGDLNRDGQEDIVALWSDGQVRAMLDPEGGQTPIPLVVNGKGLSMAAADLDGNGSCDLAVLLQAQDGYRLLRLLNETRQEKLAFNISYDPIDIDAPGKLLAGDFDRDGSSDIAVVSNFGSLQMLYTALAPRTHDIMEGVLCPDALALDYNRDGTLDVLMLGADGNVRIVGAAKGETILTAKPKVVSIDARQASRLRNSDFEPDNKPDLLLTGGTRECCVLSSGDARNLPVVQEGDEQPLFAGATCARDLTGNKRADLVVMREDARGSSPSFAIYLNTGAGMPSHPDAILPISGGGFPVTCLDYWRNRLVAGGDFGLCLFEIGPVQIPLRAVTRVRFIEGYAPIPQLPAPLSAAVADFDGNGKADIAALDASGKLTLWLAGENGEKFMPTATSILLGGEGKLQAIDFDRDSFPDILFIPTDPNARPQLLRNRRDGNLTEDWEGLLPAPPRDLRGAPALGDFDQDGDLDCLWPNAVGRLQYSDGHGGWDDGPAVPVVREGGRVLYFSGELCCADFGGHGKADVAAVMQPEDGSEQFLVLLEGTGRSDEPFVAHLSNALRGRIFDLTWGEFNNDGRLDLAVGFAKPGEPARLTLLQLLGDGSFGAFEGTPSARGELLDMTLDDLDNDGDLDLLISERVDGRPVVGLWVNNGSGSFVDGGPADESLRAALGEFGATNLSLADFTGDGRPDLLALDKDGNVVLIRSTIQS
ncbi:MAG: VCBS repeat-containing protein [Planctomycetes bacterium]|nr:VCBS repeat-containing protein [Planctomycetota bacterium]